MGSKRHRERALQLSQQQHRGGRRVEVAAPAAPPRVHTKRDSATPKNTSQTILEAVTAEKLATTMEVLALLNQNIDLFRSPAFKELRKVVFPLVQPLNSTAGTSYISRISEALKDERWLGR